eukprot:TRINITY_DN3959_c0_g1_i1.p1 TRINITY_DN3959_c0_g1~~TRINITY_DN3959_c0_g1_i1.p1  ORF type:complete len:164 (-),score=51.44 TRINITY_DN3959_c0_g1_i1:67-558(-)
MKVSANIRQLLIEQVIHELEAAFVYYSFATRWKSMGMNNIAEFFEKQACEEFRHSRKFRDYLIDCNVEFNLPANEFQPKIFQDLIDCGEQFVLEEETNTKFIHAIFNAARKEGDLSTEVFLNYFINEQVEEEAQAHDFLEKAKNFMKMPNDTGLALFNVNFNK